MTSLRRFLVPIWCVFILMLALAPLPSVHAQSITVVAAGASAPAAIPVDRPGALALLVLAMGACVVWGVRTRRVSLDTLRAWIGGGIVVTVAGVGLWGEDVRAQLQQLQRSFTQAGETAPIPVTPTAMAPDGTPLGFLPVVFQNQSTTRLRVTGVTEPLWSACFPQGIPASLPTTPPRGDAACVVGSTLEMGGSCWVDVAKLCADGAGTVRGTHPSTLAADVAIVNVGSGVSHNVLTNDSDQDGPLEVASFLWEGATRLAGPAVTVAQRGTLEMLRNGTYTFQVPSDFSGANPVVVRYTVHTGASTTLTIAVNHPPVASADAANVTQDSSVTVAVLANDTDADGDSLTVTGVTQGANGSVVVDAVTGNPRYQPNAGFAGSDSFTYTLSDGRGGTAAGTVSVTINPHTPVNRAPVSVPDSLSVAEGGTATTLTGGYTSVLANDVDPDNDPLTAVLVSPPLNGTVIFYANGTFNYTHNGSETTADAFTYRANDGSTDGNTVAVSITVTPVNDAPIAGNDSFAMSSDGTLIIPVSILLANDTDAEGDTLTVKAVTNPVNGTVQLTGGGAQVTFNPTMGFEGTARFDYTVSDGHGGAGTGSVSIAVGSANAPSIVVMKSLVAIAHGTGGTSVKFPITTRLVDTDGSESLSIRVSGVPANLSFNAGTNLGGGVWQLGESDLPNLVLNLPGSYATTATTLTVGVTSTEVNSGATASTSSAVTLKAGYTTVDITTTANGSYTGSSASEFIQGGNGNNTINASNGNNIVNGGAGDDDLTAGSGSDIIDGGPGDDVINAGSGTDVLIGGPGNDVLGGGVAGEGFVDVFIWNLGDQGPAGSPAVDTIQNFATSAASINGTGGDVLHLRDLLQGESVGPANGAGNLADYMHFEISGGNTIVHVSHSGGFGADSHAIGANYTNAAETQQIVLQGVDLQAAYSGVTTDQQVITELLNNNKLIVD